MSHHHPKNPAVLHLGHLLEKEREQILRRRQEAGKSSDLDNDSLGIALSGGGIRSATICLGILRTFNQCDLLQTADYLSSVSGGGYLAAYIHGSLHQHLPKGTPVDKEQTARAFQQLFSESDLNHMMQYREYLYIWQGKSIQRIVSNIWLFLVALRGTIAHSLWWIAPLVYRWAVYQIGFLPDTSGWIHLIIMLVIGLVFGVLMSPNNTSPHRFYKNRLKKAYLIRGKRLKLWQLDNPKAPYPLINATISVNYDKYDRMEDISYRGPIKSNYFLFSPLYCGSQVTGYIPSDHPTYRSLDLATAMTTSAAAVNTFMGNVKLPFAIRQIMALLNLRTGYLAPNPGLRRNWPAWWPYYTFLEVMGNSDTTAHRIQLSDGGHIENLGIYEMLRRKVKVIIALDCGADKAFKFEDLRNLVMRARSELGVVIDFHPNAKPQDVIRPDVTSGFSEKYFVVAKISSMKGSYCPDYEGILIYIKSSLMVSPTFDTRNIKNMVKRLIREGEKQRAEEGKRSLDSHIYRTYNPDFPHESTTDQFFDEAQWNAYYDLGAEIGGHVCGALDWKPGDAAHTLYEKGLAVYERY